MEKILFRFEKNASTAQILYILKLIANVNTRRTEY